MMSSILLNDSIYYSNSQYQRISQLKEFEKKKILPKIDKKIKSKSNTIIIDNKFLTVRNQKKTFKSIYLTKKFI